MVASILRPVFAGVTWTGLPKTRDHLRGPGESWTIERYLTSDPQTQSFCSRACSTVAPMGILMFLPLLFCCLSNKLRYRASLWLTSSRDCRGEIAIWDFCRNRDSSWCTEHTAFHRRLYRGDLISKLISVDWKETHTFQMSNQTDQYLAIAKLPVWRSAPFTAILARISQRVISRMYRSSLTLQPEILCPVRPIFCHSVWASGETKSKMGLELAGGRETIWGTLGDLYLYLTREGCNSGPKWIKQQWYYLSSYRECRTNIVHNYALALTLSLNLNDRLGSWLVLCHMNI